MYSGKKAQHDFPKMRGGGGVKGRLELFQKFIRFGSAALPLSIPTNINIFRFPFLATLVALHFTPVSKSVSEWVGGQSFGLA